MKMSDFVDPNLVDYVHSQLHKAFDPCNDARKRIPAIVTELLSITTNPEVPAASNYLVWVMQDIVHHLVKDYGSGEQRSE